MSGTISNVIKSPVTIKVTGIPSVDFLSSSAHLMDNLRVLKAVNTVLANDIASQLNVIEVNVNASEDLCCYKNNEVLSMAFKSTSDPMKVMNESLMLDHTKARDLILSKYPFLLVENNTFDAINIILHERMDGMGDLIFPINLAHLLRSRLPEKLIRLIFHSDDDVKKIEEAQLISPIDSKEEFQWIDGIQIINAGKENLQEKMFCEVRNWEIIQNKYISSNDVSIVSSLGSDELEVWRNISQYKRQAGVANKKIQIYEMGFNLNPVPLLKNGQGSLGIGKNNLGLPPVSPYVMHLYSKKHYGDSSSILSDRKRILNKFKGWTNTIGEKAIDRIANSNWGFLYSHMTPSVINYFDVFKYARENNNSFANRQTTFFLAYGLEAIATTAQKIARDEGYKMLSYSRERQELELIDNGIEGNNVTIVVDNCIPRKLFNELFLYSDDLPTLVTGPDNLINVLFLNTISSGRPFFWEVRPHQNSTDILTEVQAIFNREIRDKLSVLWSLMGNDSKEERSKMFLDPKQSGHFFADIAKNIFSPTIFEGNLHHMILWQIYNNLPREQKERLLDDFR